MDEVIKQYINDNYIVIFASLESYYCYDVKTKTKLSLRGVEKELGLVFGGIKVNQVLYAWILTKTERLNNILNDFKDRLNYGSITLDELNDIIIKDECTQMCT